MLSHDWQEQLTAPTRQLQIVVGALTVGCVTFMAIAIVLQSGAMANPPGVPFISYVALAMSAFAVLARVVVVPAVVARGCAAIARAESGSTDSTREAADGDVIPLVGLYTTKTIIAGALFEGAAFFLLISYLLEGQMLSLVAAIVMIVAVAMHFPTHSRVAGWIESKSERINQQRQFGR